MTTQPIPRVRTCPRAALLGAALVLAVAGPALSTTLLRFSIERMSREAVMVVQGHVAWDYSARPDPDGPIYTFTGIEVTRCMGGDCPEAVTLKHRGGTVGDITTFIPGMPRFEPGQEVVLFLEHDPEGEPDMYYTVGMAQGFFLVRTDPDTGAKTAVQQLGSAAIAEPDESGVIKIKKGAKPLVMSVDDLAAQVQAARQALGKGGGK